jgi:hypothetical protein
MKTRFVVAGLIAVAIVAAIAARDRSGKNSSGNAQAAPTDFDTHWHDGRAEVDGYRLEVSRYGQHRTGQAAAIYVTEPFSSRHLVKVDDPKADARDTFDALKLNLTRDFQTGIYDYNTMVSVFVRSSDFSPVKVSFTSTEWCGNVYEEMRRTGNDWRQTVSSYFEGETGTANLSRPSSGLLEDELWIRLRGLREPFLEAGETREIQLLPGAFHRRIAHRPAKWATATIERLKRTESVNVPAGNFECDVYVLRLDDREGYFHVESAYPHRIVVWDWRSANTNGRPAGVERGELTGSDRVVYWEMNRNGDQKNLKRLGLRPIPIP